MFESRVVFHFNCIADLNGVLGGEEGLNIQHFMIKYPLCFHHTSSGDRTQSMFGTAGCCHAARPRCRWHQSIAQSRVRS